MATQDPMAPITRLTSLAIVEEGGGSAYKALYPARLSQQEVIDIPVTDELVGAIVFDKDTEELETYSAAGSWLAILTAGSDINVDHITATSLQATNVNVISSLSAGTVNVATLNVGADMKISGAIAGSSSASNITVTLDTGAGSGATSTITGSITSGQFSLHTGTSPVMGGIIGTFSIPAGSVDHFTGAYGVMFSPASSVTIPFPVYVTTSMGLFVVGLGATTLAASTTYVWNYHILGTV